MDEKRRQLDAKRREREQVERRLKDLEGAILAEQEELGDLQRVYDALNMKVELPPRTGATPGSVADAAIQALRRAGRPMRGREVYEALGRKAKLDSVNWSLWDAEKRGLIQRVRPGLYATLGYSGGDKEGLAS